MLRVRFSLSRMLVSCSCVKLSCQAPLVMRCPASLFIGEEKTQVTEENKEKNEREEGIQGCRGLLLIHSGPADPVDVNRDGSTS